MHRDPKREAQIVEEAGLTAPHEEAPSVANPHAVGEESIEAARAIEAAKKDENPQQQKKPTEKDAKQESGARPKLSSQDRLDRERAVGEGMVPPPSNP